MPFIIDSTTIFDRPVTTIGGCGTFSLGKTFDCGQAFRFDPVSADEAGALFPALTDFIQTWAHADMISGTAFGKTVLFLQNPRNPDTIAVINADREDCISRWIPYLALDVDYDAIDRFLMDALPEDEDRLVMERAVSFGRGIRILRQDPFEAVISFIISQNNNIPRIKKIIAALCESLGEETDVPRTYAFPTADAICQRGLAGLAPIRAGFRGKYILDAAEKIASGEVNLGEIERCADFNAALAMLQRINGIGPKVGSCALLFGFGRTEAFPVDVWMKKSLARHFPKRIDTAAFGQYAGIAQQYLFYYERYGGSQQ